MVIMVHNHIVQGSDEWLALRTGLLTASEIKLIMTDKTLKAAHNDKQRAHVSEIAAQVITGYTEPSYINDDMLRGMADEITARDLYSEHYADVTECGFITNDEWGFTLGYSADGLVGDDGLIEIKSRRQKYHVATICGNTIPDEYMLQVQTGLLVSQRKWCDFISFCAGLPMFVHRVYPDDQIQAAIIAAAGDFYDTVADVVSAYHSNLAAGKFIPTQRITDEEEEITI